MCVCSAKIDCSSTKCADQSAKRLCVHQMRRRSEKKISFNQKCKHGCVNGLVGKIIFMYLAGDEDDGLELNGILITDG